MGNINLNSKINVNNINENAKTFNAIKNLASFQNLTGKDKDLIRRISTSFSNLLKDMELFITRSTDISNVLNENSVKIDTQMRILINILSKIETDTTIKNICKKLSKSDYITKKEGYIIMKHAEDNKIKKKK